MELEAESLLFPVLTLTTSVSLCKLSDHVNLGFLLQKGAVVEIVSQDCKWG